MFLFDYLNNLVIPFFSSFNWVDLVLIAVFIFYAVEGFAVGFVASFFDLLAFIGSFLIGLKFYNNTSKFLSNNFSISQGFSNTIGFFILTIISEIILGIVFRKFAKHLLSIDSVFPKRLNSYLGIIPGVFSASILLTFLLTILVSFPFSPFLKQAIFSSKIGSFLVSNTQGFEKSLKNIFGGAVNETLTFFTVEPKSDEFINLKFKKTDGTIDEDSEEKMLLLVNKERENHNLKPLVSDNNLKKVARNYSFDMLSRGFFSHYNPEGLSPFDRLAKANITFFAAGENLALAPSVEFSMQGLMNSPGHRANILSPDFGKIGIGVVDGGIYGKMFTQEFTD